ncbi:MAG: iron-containing alcohol dehydrogenase, partial [Clostridia bacterium]|nr:iron-containing alcohol dehydrogenase [Clostridia bacterium]
IPSLLKGLPHRVLMASSMDALIHAVESFLSPKSTATSRLFSTDAAERILRVYLAIREKGAEGADAEELLVAANHAGIAFSNAGCGQIHAMSYPIGGTFHLPHGESNHQLFLAVMDFYAEKDGDVPGTRLKELWDLFSRILGGDGKTPFRRLIEEVMERQPMRSFGMTEEQCAAFAETVNKTQKRLTSNAYVPVSVKEMEKIYLSIL